MFTKRTLGSEIKCMSNLIGRYMATASAKYELTDLTGQQMHILGYIDFFNKKGNPVFQKDIENELNVRPPTATSMIKILVEKGYIIRESVPNDARLKKLVLTLKAIEIIEKTNEMMKNTEQCISEEITDEEKEVFFRVMDKMKNNLFSYTLNQNKASQED